MRFAFLILIASLFLPFWLNAQTKCNSVFLKPYSPSSFSQAHFEGDETYYFFSKDHKDPEIHIESEHDILKRKETDLPSRSALSKTLSSIGFFLNTSREIGYHMIRPMVKLTKKENQIEVWGSPRISPDQAQLVSERLAYFDHRMSQLGFKIPNNTHVVLSNATIPALNKKGPVVVNMPIRGLWDGLKKRYLMYMNPIFNKTTFENESILFHERMHLLVRESYGLDSVVFKNPIINEALSDFAAAHILNSPEMGKGYAVTGEDLPLRNIETREANSGTKDAQFHIEHILSVQRRNNHDMSLFISNFFWKLREQIGSEQMDKLFKRLVNNLDLYHASYSPKAYHEIKTYLENETGVYLKQTLQVIDYVLAVALRTAAQTKDEKLYYQIQRVVNEHAIAVRRPFDKIMGISTDLKMLGRADSSEGKSSEIADDIALHLYGAGGLAFDASVLYFSFSWMFGQ